jgi:hypothetical protein
MQTIPAAVARVAFIQDLLSRDKAALWRALNAIAEAPHRALLSEHVLSDAGDAFAIAPDLTLDTLLEPEAVAITERRAHFAHKGLRWRFLKAYDQRTRPTEQTLPNRAAAHLLRVLLATLRPLLHTLRAAPHDDPAMARAFDNAATLHRRLNGLLLRADALADAAPLEDLPLDHNVLNGHPLYRQVLDALLAMRRLPKDGQATPALRSGRGA